VSVEALCDRAGVERSRFDSRYAGIEDCFFDAYSVEFNRYRRQAEAARDGLGAWRDRLRATAYALLRFLAEDERVTHFTVVEVRRAGERSALLIGEGIQELIDLLDEGRDQPGAAEGLTRATAESLAGGLFNQLYLAVAQGGSPQESQIGREAMYVVVEPYLGLEAAREELAIDPPPPPAADGTLPLSPVGAGPFHRAFIDLCFEHGFERLTVEALCARAGLSPARFEARYADLDDCFCAVFEAELDQLLIDFAVALAGAEGWRNRLRVVAYAFHRWLSAEPARTHLMVTEIRSGPERAQLIQLRGIGQMVDLLDQGRSASPEGDRITRATAEALAGGILTRIYAAVGEGRLGEEAEIVPELMYTAVLPYVEPELAAEELRIPPPPPAARNGGETGSAGSQPAISAARPNRT
jgi:AcrR family transcriptional regulator